MSINETAIITSVVAAITAIVTSYISSRKKNNYVPTKVNEKVFINPVQSNRLVSITHKMSTPSKVFKTRKYDNVISPHSGVIIVSDSKVIIENDSSISTLTGLFSLKTTNAIVDQGEILGVVGLFENDEGRLTWSVETKNQNAQKFIM